MTTANPFHEGVRSGLRIIDKSELPPILEGIAIPPCTPDQLELIRANLAVATDAIRNAYKIAQKVPSMSGHIHRLGESAAGLTKSADRFLSFEPLRHK